MATPQGHHLDVCGMALCMGAMETAQLIVVGAMLEGGAESMGYTCMCYYPQCWTDLSFLKVV